ncbi:MAG: division/cell wall cluster transcriptional repressor MraZ [Mogibacterium sp.]|nr:division/cell wall cluster transcriptional repressor MraZ [Mogibacterium sp.]
MFHGVYENSIDSKNRMIIPAKFRDDLGGQCMLTKGYDQCLYIYTMKEYEEMAEKISALPQSDREFRAFIRDFFGNSEIVYPDAQGRIIIPAKLREYANIKKDLVTLGAMNKIEIWSAELMNESSGENLMDNQSLTDKLGQFGL